MSGQTASMTAKTHVVGDERPLADVRMDQVLFGELFVRRGDGVAVDAELGRQVTTCRELGAGSEETGLDPRGDVGLELLVQRVFGGAVELKIVPQLDHAN